jgi:hypothetical protein
MKTHEGVNQADEAYLSLNAYVKNATDYAVKPFWMNTSGSYSLDLNDPRTFGAVVPVKF